MGGKQIPEASLDQLFGQGGAGAQVLSRDEGEFSRDHLVLPAAQVELEGPYVRSWSDDEDFTAFLEGVREEGEIHQAIGIRTKTVGMDVRYILIYGSQRLEAARRLDLSLPCRNYGEITEEAAFTLQILENLARHEMHVADEARGYHLLGEMGGMSHAEMGRLLGRDRSTVARYAAGGAGVVLLDKEDRERVYQRPKGLPSLFFKIYDEKLDADAAAEQLRAWGRKQPTLLSKSAKKRKGTQEPVSAKAYGRGRSFRAQWRPEDLVEDPVGFASRLKEMLMPELALIRAELRTVKGGREALQELDALLSGIPEDAAPS